MTQTLTEQAVELNSCGRYLLVDVLRPDGDFTNNGVSSLKGGKRTFFAPCLTGNFDLSSLNVTKDVVLSVLPPAFDGCPLRFTQKDAPRGMAGGNFIYTSDSRFSKTYGAPISLHDRYE